MANKFVSLIDNMSHLNNTLNNLDAENFSEKNEGLEIIIEEYNSEEKN